MQSWRDEEEKEVEGLEIKIVEMQIELRRKKSQLKSLIEVIKSEGMTENQKDALSLADAARRVLLAEDEPTHYRNLAEIIMADKVIPGKDPYAVLLTRISRDERFVRTKPGTYALAEWKLPAQKKSRASKARSKSKKGNTR